jgi:hypothetical protein
MKVYISNAMSYIRPCTNTYHENIERRAEGLLLEQEELQNMTRKESY